jgi:hypothetical protein
MVSPMELINRCEPRRPIELIEHFQGEPFALSDRRT